jgi:hypothetical protein
VVVREAASTKTAASVLERAVEVMRVLLSVPPITSLSVRT